MEKTVAQMITELLNMGLTREFLADKFKVNVVTIERWATGTFAPKFASEKYITQVYNGYMNNNAKTT